MVKSYRVSAELKPFIRRILIRSFASCRMVKDSSGQWWCKTNVSSNTFHKIVQRAKCEKKSKEDGVTYVTAAERKNEVFMTEFFKGKKSSACVVINDYAV